MEFLNLTFNRIQKKIEKAFGDGVNLFSYERTFLNLQKTELTWNKCLDQNKWRIRSQKFL
ncbi:hypothetical protein [Leptospira kirschneri]|uniref:Uncharacterized protein n=2 Tax=Leptospira kirschneri TaxID=29507 RepID=A0A0E2B7D8_9LEPT|nr:hypothetical protein [Leptospira kirschneri]EKO17254.1 hypothetical protein LEP1GSC081_2251 [Leptospira kirschneri str. H1]EKO62292.1 hypothetical protein LEP1GSC082_4449 [Leptospira kirschneri str. H2]EMK24775.1 hypothetical protein LEP1GSC008_1898 [Leptospira kirschneri serovar Bulgarica str. Nikolaevo]UML81324.1 hypothetical protein FH602_06785 [Leptospira kirschneri]